MENMERESKKIIKEGKCVFCEPKSVDHAYFRKYGRERIDLARVYETSNLFVKVDNLPVSPTGQHFLVISKKHCVAFGQRPDLKDELGHVLYEMEQISRQPMVFIEHGGGLPQFGHGPSNNQSVYHVHGHIIETGGFNIIESMKDVLSRKEKINYKTVELSDLSPIKFLKQNYTGHPYLYIQQHNRAIWTVDSNGTFPSQIAQRNMSNLLSGEVLDWKKINYKDQLARESVTRISRIVDECKYSAR